MPRTCTLVTRAAVACPLVALLGLLARPGLTAETPDPAVNPARSSASPFRFLTVSEESLGLWEGDQPVLVYNHGVVNRDGVPADRARSTYIHPLYGLDGEVLTDDFPADHTHHRGLFWAWPHVKIGEAHHDLWMLRGVRQNFERWLARETGPDTALLGVENGWYVGAKRVLREQAWFRIHRATPRERAVDVEFRWEPTEQPVTLAGAEGKSYGGLTLRFAPRTQTVITTPLGQGSDDLAMTRLPWADLSARFAGRDTPSGAAIFISPGHPDHPPMWLTRHYGVLCVGWPGVEPETFEPGEPIRCGYRVWIHRGAADVQALARAYAAYAASEPGRWFDDREPSGAAAAAKPAGQRVAAEVREDRVVIRVNDAPFTEYLFGPDTKYPYFHPVLGPRSGRTVTVHQTEPYPHHSSIFFGCDRVNGGNYWQEGLERGRIASHAVRLVRSAGERIEFEQTCRWERPGAEAPFDDVRRITVSAPDPDVRFLDFDVTLTARTEVKIEQNNHSLFAARMAPDLAVQGGGTLMNAHGDTGEKATFGRPAPWADYRGNRAGVTEGVTILSHPTNRWFPEPWFTRDYGFFSPTPLNWIDGGAVVLAPGEVLRLRYRVVVHANAPSREAITRWFEAWRR